MSDLELRVADCGHFIRWDAEPVGIDVARTKVLQGRPVYVFLCDWCAQQSGLSRPKQPKLTTKSRNKS